MCIKAFNQSLYACSDLLKQKYLVNLNIIVVGTCPKYITVYFLLTGKYQIEIHSMRIQDDRQSQRSKLNFRKKPAIICFQLKFSDKFKRKKIHGKLALNPLWIYQSFFYLKLYHLMNIPGIQVFTPKTLYQSSE